MKHHYGTISIFTSSGHKLDTKKYYSIVERKKIMEAWERIYDNSLDGHGGYYEIYPILQIAPISDSERKKRLTRFAPKITSPEEEPVKYERPKPSYTNIKSPYGIASEKNNSE